MSESGSNSMDLEHLRDALDSDVKVVSIRLREGEYQFSLAKAIASFELELHFPDAKDLVRKLFGEKRTEDQQFLNKIQTILKKMEKSGVIKILPKEKPWELQRYALVSFKFLDVEKNLADFATKNEMEKAKHLMKSQPKPIHVTVQRPRDMIPQLSLLIGIMAVSLTLSLWTLAQSPANLITFASTFCLAAASSVILGVLVARKR